MQSQQKTLIAIGCFIGITVVFFLLVIWPIFQGILQDQAAILEQELELLQIREDREQALAFESVSAQHAQEFARMESLFVDTETPVSFFRFLDETALTYGIQMEKTPGNPQEGEGDPWPSFDMRLAGRGPYPGFWAFLARIENAPYLMEVKNLTLSNTGGQEGTPTGEIEFSLLLKVFAK